MAKATETTHSNVEPITKEQEVLKSTSARILSPFTEMEQMFKDHFPRNWLHPFQWERPQWGEITSPFAGKLPHVDIIDRDNEILVRAELPGIDKKDLDVSMTDNTVTIKGSTCHEGKEEKGDYYRCETSRGSFSRTIPLPSIVDNARTKTTFKDGVLELTVPKVEKSKRRNIHVD